MALFSSGALTGTAIYQCGTWALFRLLPFTTILLQYEEKKGDVYNILWALVFGFATINILSLVARRFEPSRSRMSFGEILAILVVVASVILLAWEMLYLFHILPIKLEPR